ncbi:MAG: STAS/SEC14 domain-containing protein [Ramlibacter sp.]
MAFKLRYKHGSAMSVVEVTGLAFAEQAQDVIEAIQARTMEHEDRRLLIDLTDVVGTLGPAEHQAIGMLAVRYLSHLERVASLVPEDKITRISEATAQKHGLQLKVFTDLTGAVNWLVGP